MNRSTRLELYSSDSKNVSVMTKLYIWSIMLELLLFFVIAGEGFLGISTNISRLLQFCFLSAFLFKLIFINNFHFAPSPFSNLYRWYFIYFILAIFSAIYGILIGAYEVSFLPSQDTSFIRIYRPIFEFFITIYYFIYFVVLPRYIITNAYSVDYLFSIFTKLFFFCLIVGLFDVFVQQFIPGYDGIPRHLSEPGELRTAPDRFHGIAGEPRDAFAYMVFGFGFLLIKDIWNNEKKLSTTISILIFIAALLTQSASGLLGLIFSFVILMLFFYIPRMSFSRLIKFISLLLTGLIFLIIAINSSPRLLEYLEAFQELYVILEAGDEVTSVIAVAMNNIFPLWLRWVEILELNFVPLILGTGLGTSGIANIIYAGENILNNTNANFVRTIFENGIIGTYIFVLAFLRPLRHYRIPTHIRNQWMFAMIFILGAFFAHRTAGPFIFLGLTLTIFSQLSSKCFSK
tara:strand:- start:1388 stop:2767 length:1380 start_codon:yes stop_codon:yes gene_type:complete